MEEDDKDWMMIRMVGGWVFLLVPAHPGSPGQRAIRRLLCRCTDHASADNNIDDINIFTW